LDLPDQGLQVDLGARILLQEVKQSRGPADLEGRADQTGIGPGRADELVPGLLQPLIGQPGLHRIPEAQQPGEPALDRLPLIGRRGVDHRPTGQRR